MHIINRASYHTVKSLVWTVQCTCTTAVTRNSAANSAMYPKPAFNSFVFARSYNTPRRFRTDTRLTGEQSILRHKAGSSAPKVKARHPHGRNGLAAGRVLGTQPQRNSDGASQGTERTMQKLPGRDTRGESRTSRPRHPASKVTETVRSDQSRSPSFTDQQPSTPRNPPDWLKQREALKDKFPDGWQPPKRLSREAIELLRVLHKSNPTTYTTPVLAERFKTSPEAVRRILKSRFELSSEEKQRREAKRRAAREAERHQQQGLGSTEDGSVAVKTWAGDKAAERDEMASLRAHGRSE